MREKDALDKIKWDKRCKPEEYTVEFIDLGKLKSIKYTDIKRVDEGFMALDINGDETLIPLHRIRAIKKQGEPIWNR
ncbi:DUF504 domain-containing protein [Candidatus Woesearchaeota archaeon]|nr:DUF504 domain-containing protein [Candidatus Woesearchaeota archaeon]